MDTWQAERRDTVEYRGLCLSTNWQEVLAHCMHIAFAHVSRDDLDILVVVEHAMCLLALVP